MKKKKTLSLLNNPNRLERFEMIKLLNKKLKNNQKLNQ